MRLNNSILSNLREADSKKLDDLYASVLNAQEMYVESSDDGDVFAGTEDSYAMEMLEQHLFDAIAYSGFFKDDTDPRIMPVYSKIMDLITSNASISKKDVEDAIKVSGIKEGTNGNAKILDDELTGGGVISFVGEVGNYNFVGDIDGSIIFFNKKFGIDSWEKYANIEDDAWEGKYGDNIKGTYDFETMYGEFLPEYMPNIGRALKQYAKTIKNPFYGDQYEKFGDELINFKNNEEELNESAKVNIGKLNVTNGGWSNNSTIIYGPIKVSGKDYELIYFTETDDIMCFKPGYGIDKVIDILYGDSDTEYDFNGKKVTQEEIYKYLYKDQVDLSSSDREEIEKAINSKIFNEKTGKTSYDSLNKVKLDEGAVSEQPTFEEDPRNFTEEEKEEYGLNDEGIDESGEQWLHCAWCGELVPLSECKKELNMGWICKGCQDSLYSRGEHAVYDENANFYDDIIEYEDSLKESIEEPKKDNYTATSIAEVLEHENDDYAIKIENRTANKSTKWLNISGAYLFGLYHDVSDINAENIDEYSDKDK